MLKKYLLLSILFLTSCSQKPSIEATSENLQASIGFANSIVFTFSNLGKPFKIDSVSVSPPLYFDKDRSTCIKQDDESCIIAISFRPNIPISGKQDIEINYSYNQNHFSTKKMITYDTLPTEQVNPLITNNCNLDLKNFTTQGVLGYIPQPDDLNQMIFFLIGENLIITYPGIMGLNGASWQGPGTNMPYNPINWFIVNQDIGCALPYIFNNTNITSLKINVAKSALNSYGNMYFSPVIDLEITKAQFNQLDYNNILNFDFRQIGKSIKIYTSP